MTPKWDAVGNSKKYEIGRQKNLIFKMGGPKLQLLFFKKKSKVDFFFCTNAKARKTTGKDQG